MSDIERKVIEAAIGLVARTRERYAPLMPPLAETPPIPFFGRLARARVVTLGLNPSTREFADARRWPPRLDGEGLACRLAAYFESDAPPPVDWFAPWAAALLSIGSSYTVDAAHIDLSPRATRSAGTFKRAPEKLLFLEMLRTDAPLWVMALESAPDLKCVLTAGSATNSHYLNEFIMRELAGAGVRLRGDWRRRPGPGQVAFHVLSLPSGRECPFFFCSTGPSRDNAILPQAVGVHASQIRSWLAR